MTFEFELKGLQVTVDGEYKKGFKDYFDRSFGNWLPGEPDSVEDLSVYVEGNGHKIDITEALSQDELNDLEDRFIEACNEETDSEREE